MELTKIDYNGGVVWVDKEAQINKGDYYTHKGEYVLESDGGYKKGLFKVVAQSPNLSIPNIPYIEVEENVEKLAQEYFNDNIYCQGITDFEEMVAKRSYKVGYEAASAKKWSDDDIKKAIELARENSSNTLNHPEDGIQFDYTEEQVIQSLQSKIKSIEIEVNDDLIQIGRKLQFKLKVGGYVTGEIISFPSDWNYSDTDTIWVRVNRYETGYSKSDVLDRLVDKNPLPITYQKDGKKFLKVKQVNYE